MNRHFASELSFVFSVFTALVSAPVAAQELDVPIGAPDPCPVGEELRWTQPQLMSDADWDFMLAYGCGTLAAIAAGDWPGSDLAEGPWTSPVAMTQWRGYGPEDSVRQGEDPSNSSIEPSDKVWGAETQGEVCLRDQEPSQPEIGSEGPGIAPEMKAVTDPQVLAEQADFVAMGCAEDVLPKKCRTHPYIKRILLEAGDGAWSESP